MGRIWERAPRMVVCKQSYSSYSSISSLRYSTAGCAVCPTGPLVANNLFGPEKPGAIM